METLSIYSLIKQSLPEETWARTISSLNFNPIIWESIQTPQFIEKIKNREMEIADWSPANLGLISINFNTSARDLLKNNSPVLDDLQVDRAWIILKGTDLNNYVNNLEDAIIIALFIRDKLLSGNTWSTIRKEFSSNHINSLESVFACLFGLLQNPIEFLEECVSVDQSIDNFYLILHSIICNPIEINQKVNILTKLATIQDVSLTPLDIYKLIQYVNVSYPEIATKFSSNIVNTFNRSLKEEISLNHSIVNVLQNLEIQILNAELQKITNHPEISQKYIQSALKNIMTIWVQLLPKDLYLSSEITPSIEANGINNGSINKPLDKELSVYENLTNHPYFHKISLLNFLEKQQYIEAEQFININQGYIQSGFLNELVSMINTLNQGELHQASLHADNAVTELNANDSDFLNYLANYPESVFYPLLESLIELNLFQDAINVTRKAISYRKTDVNLYMLLGEAYQRNNTFEYATESFYNAVLLKPDDLNIRRNLASCLEETGMWQEAYTERKYILEVSDKGSMSDELVDIHNLIECAINLSAFDEAIKLCEQAIQLNEEKGYSYSLLGKALLSSGDMDKAFTNFEKGIQLSPQTSRTWITFADAQYSSENIEGAIETLRAASHSIPTSTEIHLSLGEMHLSQTALTDALTSFKKANELEPNNPHIALKLGTTLQLLGHLEDAEQVLSNAHQSTPGHVGVAYAYAKVLLKSGERSKALPLLYIVVKSDSNNIDAYLEFADTALTSREVSVKKYPPEEVLSIIRKAQLYEPENPILHALLGEVLIINNDFLAAKNAYQVALESNLVEDEKWFTRLSLGMGRVSLALGQEDVALATLQEALQVDPTNSYIYQALCEVYQVVNLPEDALQAARAALNNAIDDVDTLTWYADQMLALSDMNDIHLSQQSTNELHKQFQTEALNALHQANQTAPKRADLLVKLGRMQYILEENSIALTTLNSVIAHEYADADDLITAGELLSELGDTCGAIACLEQAYLKHQKPSDQSTSMLLINLAELYHNDGDNESALHSLDRALENNPTYGLIYCTKAKLFQELGNEDEAISYIFEGLEKSTDIQSQLQLHTLAGNIFRGRGELKLSLDQAQEGLAVLNDDTEKLDIPDIVLIDLTTLTSELYRAILKPNRGRLLFKDIERNHRIEKAKDIDYGCSYMENFLDSIDENELTSIISQLIEINPDHPRILALQSRIFKRRRDYRTALQILHTALESANQKSWKARDINKPYSSNTSLPIWYSLYDSAVELYQWDTAIFAAQQALELAPSEPRAHINLAKAIVMRAEFQRLCEKIEVVTNSPGANAINQESRELFENEISEAINSLSIIEPYFSGEDAKLESNNINPIIKRWKYRGYAIFGNNDETKVAIEELGKLTNLAEDNKSLRAADMAALINAEVRLDAIKDEDKLNTITQFVPSDSQDPNLTLQLSLALAEIYPDYALNLLTSLTKTSYSIENPIYAMSQALLARFLINNNQYENAKSAIDNALAVFENEPKWHYMAAVIYHNIGNIVEAIHHFDEAIRLNPHNLENHLGLGKILIENSEFDSTNTKRAIQVLERACRLEPDNPDPWFYLSQAYISMGDIVQAASYADMAMSLAPQNIRLITLRGEIALHENNPQVALDFASKALTLNPDETQAILIQSQALRDMGKVNQALEVIETAMERMVDPLSLQLEYAKLLNDVRGAKAAIVVLEQLVDQNPENSELLSLLAKNMADTGEIDLAIKTAQQALQVSNGNNPISDKGKLHHLLGSLLIRSRQLDQAIHHLSESIALTPNNVDSYLELGRAQQEQRQHRQALEVFQKATRIAPNDPRPHYQAGIIFKEGKDYKASESMLRKAADLAPDDVNIRRQLAAVVALNLVHNPRPKRIVEG